MQTHQGAEKHCEGVRQFRTAPFSSRRLSSTGCHASNVCIKTLLLLLLLRHTQTRRHARRTRAHTVVPDFTAGSRSVIHLYHTPSSLPYSGAHNHRARTSIYMKSLTPPYYGCIEEKMRSRLGSPSVRAFPPFPHTLPHPRLLLRLCLWLSASLQSNHSPTSRQRYKDPYSRFMRLPFPIANSPSPQKKSLLFLLLCRACLRAFLDAGAFE